MESTIRFAFLTFIVLTPIITQAHECKPIVGELALWNGHAPALRITDSKTQKVYGVESAGEEPAPNAIPKKLLSRIYAGEHKISGSFCISLLGKLAQTPYNKNNIEIVHIKKYSDSSK